MQFPDKFHLTRDQNIRYARANFTKLVQTTSRFEGVTTTLPQTQTIMDGMSVSGVAISDIEVIVQLKRGWDFTTRGLAGWDLEFAKQINGIVALHDSLAPGELRSGQGSVITASADEFIPPLVNENDESRYLTELFFSAKSTTEKAMTVMYHLMRNQLFWDGNKRTAVLSANRIMLDGGAGLINVPLDCWEKWNELIAHYYFSNDMHELLDWTYANAIQGPEL